MSGGNIRVRQAGH